MFFFFASILSFKKSHFRISLWNLPPPQRNRAHSMSLLSLRNNFLLQLIFNGIWWNRMKERKRKKALFINVLNVLCKSFLKCVCVCVRSFARMPKTFPREWNSSWGWKWPKRIYRSLVYHFMLANIYANLSNWTHSGFIEAIVECTQREWEGERKKKFSISCLLGIDWSNSSRVCRMLLFRH